MSVGRLILVPSVALAVALALCPRPAAATDEPDALMPGTVAVVKSGKAPLAKFTAKPPKGSTFALPSAADDPTANGATLHVFDTGDPSAGDDTYALAAAGWKGLGVPAGAKGFKYKGLGTAEDPCKAVLVKPTVVKAVCKGSTVKLRPPLTGDLGIVLTVGTDPKRYCATFGGTTVQNVAGKLVRKLSPAPEACATVTTTTTTTSTTTTTQTFVFRTVVASGVCGHARAADGSVIRDLACGTLNLGSGLSGSLPSVTPDGAGNRFAFDCSGSPCVLSANATPPAPNSADSDCSDTGCNFGPPVPVLASGGAALSTCIVNTFAVPASGTVDLATGALETAINLRSNVNLTGNGDRPCPLCTTDGTAGGPAASGTPDSPATGICGGGDNFGHACTSTSSQGLSRDCPPKAAQSLGTISVNLSPLTTGTAAKADADGLFCPGQQAAGKSGCFGTESGDMFGCPRGRNGECVPCRAIDETGAASPITIGTPAPATLASVFCVPATGNFLIDGAVDLPGPGALSLPGVALFQ